MNFLVCGLLKAKLKGDMILYEYSFSSHVYRKYLETNQFEENVHELN